MSLIKFGFWLSPLYFTFLFALFYFSFNFYFAYSYYVYASTYVYDLTQVVSNITNTEFDKIYFLPTNLECFEFQKYAGTFSYYAYVYNVRVMGLFTRSTYFPLIHFPTHAFEYDTCGYYLSGEWYSKFLRISFIPSFYLFIIANVWLLCVIVLLFVYYYKVYRIFLKSYVYVPLNRL